MRGRSYSLRRGCVELRHEPLVRALWSVTQTYEQVAVSAGFSVETIYRALRGQPIRGRNAHALAAALGVELNALLKPEKSRRAKAAG